MNNDNNYLSVIQAVLQTWKGDLRVITDFTAFAERKDIVIPKDMAMQIIRAFSSVDATLFNEVSEGLYDLMQSVEDDDEDDTWISPRRTGTAADLSKRQEIFDSASDDDEEDDDCVYVSDPFMPSISRRLMDCAE